MQKMIIKERFRQYFCGLPVLIDLDRQHRLVTFLTSLNGVRLWAAMMVLLAIALGILNGEVINRDGILYINTAQAFLDNGIKAAMQVYNWPSYSILFGIISNWTGLSLESSAHILNALLMLLLVDAFIRLSHNLSNKQIRPWIAALVVLCFPPFDHRLEIYRDWGYLAMTFCALVSLQKYWISERVLSREVITWQLCMIIALLFRVEAIVLITLTPIGFLFQKRVWVQRLKRFISAYSLILLIAVLSGAFVAMGDVPLGKLIDLKQYTDPSYVFSKFNLSAEQLASHALNKYSDDYASLILGGGIVTLICWMILDNLGAFLAILLGVGIYAKRLPKASAYRLIYWLETIVVVTLFAFLMTTLIPPSRYALLGSMLLLILITYAVNMFADTKDSKGRASRYWWWFVVIGLVIGNLFNLSFHQDYKSYLREGGHWISQNIPSKIPLITNDFIIDYYAKRPHGDKIDSLAKVAKALQAAQRPFYIALKTKDKERSEVLSLLDQKPQVEFHSGHAKETLLIFYRD
ncbi:MAG: hypothetical protein P8179_04000 [Candidatus Thiodiazotropha sp.]